MREARTWVLRMLLISATMLFATPVLAKSPMPGDKVMFPHGGGACLSKSDSQVMFMHLLLKEIEQMKRMLSDDGTTECLYLSSRRVYTVVQAEYHNGPELGIIAIVGDGASKGAAGAWTTTIGAEVVSR